MTIRRYVKQGYVLAEQATEPGRIQTLEGVMSYEAGEYLVTDAPPTHMWPVKKEIFERTYIAQSPPRIITPERELAEFADVIARNNLLPSQESASREET
jgi:hypothetical protein